MQSHSVVICVDIAYAYYLVLVHVYISYSRIHLYVRGCVQDTADLEAVIRIGSNGGGEQFRIHLCNTSRYIDCLFGVISIILVALRYNELDNARYNI